MIDEIRAARDAALADIAAATTFDEVVAIDQQVLGKRGPLATIKTGLGALATVEDRKAAGRALNEAHAELVAAVAARREELAAAERDARIAAERLDLTELAAPTAPRPHPHRHPGVGAPRGRLRRARVHRGRGPRGGDRLAQLRGAQHAGQPPGAQRVRHPVRRPRRRAAGHDRAAHAHVAGADPGDARRRARRSTSSPPAGCSGATRPTPPTCRCSTRSRDW